MLPGFEKYFGFLLFLSLFGASYFLWGLYYRYRKANEEKEAEQTENFKDIDMTKLLNTTGDKDYLHGVTDKYKWSQNEREIEMTVDVPDGCDSKPLTKKDVSCIIKTDKLRVVIRGDVILDGAFYATVDPDECNWQIGVHIKH